MRAVFAALALAILVAAFLLLRPSDDKPSPTAQATPTATATASAATGDATPAATESPTPTPTADPGPLLTAAKVTKIRVTKGDTVRFRVRSPKAEEVHVHGYDLKKDLPAGRTVSMSFKATIDGIFVIELEGSGTQIAQLRVDPS
jgi:FtsP/CotA-like multicopper oxidase with cupredoxin domain